MGALGRRSLELRCTPSKSPGRLHSAAVHGARGEGGHTCARHYISNDIFEPPCIVYPINPFMKRHSVVYKSGHVKRIAKSMTRNFKYAICVQKISENVAIREYKCVMGHTTRDEVQDIAAKVWDLFHLPICTIRVIENGKVMLSAIEPCPLQELGSRELKLLRKANEWQI